MYHHITPSTVEIKNGCSYNSSTSTRLYGVYRKKFPFCFLLTLTQFIKQLVSDCRSQKKTFPLLVLISGLPADVQYSDPYNKAATAKARSAYFTSISGFPFVRRYFSHYYQLICIFFRIETFQVRFLPLLNHLCNVFFHNIQTCRPTF